MKYTVQVEADIKDNGVDVMVKQVEGGKVLSFREISHMLAGGISLLVRMVEKNGEMKDHELMTEIIKHLNEEFISTRSFSDAEIITKENN